MYAWVDPSKDADTKAAYKFPHHFVSNGSVGAASANGVRAALARASQSATNIPAADVSGVKSHLQKHLDKFNSGSKKSLELDPDEDLETLALAMVVETRGRVLLVREEIVRSLADLHGRANATSTLLALESAARTVVRQAKPPPEESSVEVIPLKGVLRPTPSILSLLFGGGGGGLLSFRSALAKAAANDKVEAIVMDVNSPGGFVDLIPEVAADIRAARAQKPVVAVANTTAGSAAYWLASQASQLVVSPSGEVGSIGVYQIHEDLSGMLAKEGVNVTIVRAGKYKIEGHPFGPLSEDATAAMQSDVNDYYDMFTSDVAKGRGVTQDEVKSGYGEGRMALAKRAVKLGLADKVEQLSDTVKRLSHPGARAALQRADVEALGIDAPEPFEAPSDIEAEDVLVLPALTAEERDRVLSALAG
jgi:signal peptide peptidase SppA